VADSIDYDTALGQLKANLDQWNNWAFKSKVLATLLGGLVAALGVLIASKQLPDIWHIALSAVTAASIFAYELLKPYNEYKQFRAAFAHLEVAYITLQGVRTPENLAAAIKAQRESREMLKENWEAPGLKH